MCVRMLSINKLLYNRLNELKDIGRIKMENLKQSHMDTYKAYLWYRDNKTLFKGKIYGPIQLCINVKDKRYVHQVETALGGRDGNHLRVIYINIYI